MLNQNQSKQRKLQHSFAQERRPLSTLPLASMLAILWSRQPTEGGTHMNKISPSSNTSGKQLLKDKRGKKKIMFPGNSLLKEKLLTKSTESEHKENKTKHSAGLTTLTSSPMFSEISSSDGIVSSKAKKLKRRLHNQNEELSAHLYD